MAIVEHYKKRANWIREMPFYKGICKKHGEYTNYLQGWKEELCCPECEKERLRQK